MSQETQIDFEKIICECPTDHESEPVITVKECKAMMREACKEAIRLAGPLFINEVALFEDTQSIIDAVESVTLKIVGK